MKLIDKILVFNIAFKKANKKKLMKKVYSAIKVGGLKALKESIVDVAIRDDVGTQTYAPDEIKSINQEQQLAHKHYKNICAKKITVIVYVPNMDMDYLIKETLDSIENQIYYNYEIILVMPTSYVNDSEFKINDSIKTFYIEADTSMNELSNTIEGSYFIILNAGNHLLPDALYYFVIEMEKGYAFAYSDECICNFEDGTISRYYYKTDFLKCKFNSNLYTEQSVCFNTSDIIESGYFESNISDISAVINERKLKLLRDGKDVFHIDKILLLRNYYYEMKAYDYNLISYDINNKTHLQNPHWHEQRNILLVSHELTLTGAPIALHYAAKAILGNGYYPVIISPSDGRLRQTIVDDCIPVIIDSSIFSEYGWLKLAKNFDLVLVCTLAGYKSIEHIETTNIPTLWWAHEARESYENGNLKNTLPDSINDNIHVYCGGEYARKMLLSYRPNYTSDLLLYAVPDFSKIESKIEYKIPDIEDKIVFSIIGTIMKRKGQDILAKAIMEMPSKIVKKCKFIFVGKMFDATVYIKVKELKIKYPDEVILIDEVSRDVLMEIYKLCDCIVCASRDDPMPIFMTEAMMLSKICICSENTGTAALIKDGINGFIYNNDDYHKLMQKIVHVAEHINDLEEMKKKSRETYENNFTMESFSKKLISTIDSIISR